ncbi:MAG: acetyl-CoA carboxylase biotin carboxyl carrier protein subunit [Chloroflexi bacterium]|nr:acetyl-CoA carboxylase biotin carboxyl carrier protein subunit [Chloroflexota bacterium]
MKYIATIEDQTFEFEINGEDDIIADGDHVAIDFRSIAGQSVYSMLVNGRSYEALVQVEDDNLQVLLRGRLYIVTVEDERQIRLRGASSSQTIQQGDFHLTSPMPGLIVSIPVKEDQEVSEGDRLIVLESMKMQNELKSPRAGIVRNIRVSIGENVDQDQVMLTIS